MPITRLPPHFYASDDVVAIARMLLGKVLCTSIGGTGTKAIITETEAYAGVDDRASHAFGGRRTNRTEPMYAAGGISYVYLCYGIHHLFNVVTGPRDVPHAILVRAGLPLEGIDAMLHRRRKAVVDDALLAGPGSLGQALGIDTGLTGTSLEGPHIWFEDHDIEPAESAIAAGPRIGVDYAGEDASLPYRFVVGAAGLSAPAGNSSVAAGQR